MAEQHRGGSADIDAPGEVVPAGRREQIVALVSSSGPMTVRTLATRLRVSNDTIRRDLDQLASERRLKRTHGGAMSMTSAPAGAGSSFLDTAFTPGKAIVGELASHLVADGAVLMINAGATPVALVRELRTRRDLTIVTNNLLIPPAVPPESCRFMYVLGGETRLIGQSTVGSVAQQLAGSGLDIRADIAFVSVGGVTVERGYSTGDLPEAAMMHEMMARAAKVAVLADSSKFDRQLFANVADIGEADYFVTDVTPPTELREALLSRGVEIITPTDPR